MQKPVLVTEVLNERQKSCRMVVLFMCLAIVAWFFITVAQGVVLCGTVFFGFRGK